MATAQSKERIGVGQLTGEQRRATQRVLINGENLFITGAAGTGKSFVLMYIIQELELRYPGQVAVTAPTGTAAANIGGQTIHSFGGVGVGTGSIPQLCFKARKSPGALQRWRNSRVLVIDEVSMLDASLFETLEVIASSLRRSKAPFGGLQLVLCGDFLQLPPVSERGQPISRFCFVSPSWGRCGLTSGTVVLQDSMRQAGDADFAKLLNEVRLGIVSARLEAMIKECKVDLKPLPADDIEPTKLYFWNKNVDDENAMRLAQLPGEPITFCAKDEFPTDMDLATRDLFSRPLGKKNAL